MSIKDLQKAAADKDVELAISALADDVVIRSPLTDQITFDRSTIRPLFETVYEKFAGLTYTEISDRVLVGRATVNGQPIEETLLLTFDDHDKITEITLFIRPLTGLTAVMAALGPTLARKNRRRTAGLLKVMTAPLVAATRFGDRFGVKLALAKRSG